MNKNKIRIRSKYELEIRKKEFLESCRILEKLKINYFLVSGILLGAVRDNKLISWDWDIELSLFSDVLEKKLSVIENELIKKKFTIIKINRKKNQLKIDYFSKIFLEILEIFLDTVFLLTMPDLATCIRID